MISRVKRNYIPTYMFRVLYYENKNVYKNVLTTRKKKTKQKTSYGRYNTLYNINRKYCKIIHRSRL